MKTHCRCRKCRSRRVLPKHPGDYRMRKKCPRCKADHFSENSRCECGCVMLTAPKCLTCGSREYTADKYRNDGKDSRPVCHSTQCCPYPHRMGSNNLAPEHGQLDCLFNADGSQR